MVVGLMGCEKPLGYELPYEGDRLVVIGLLDPAEEITIHVSRTTSPVGPRPDSLTLDGALVKLFEDNGPPDTLLYKEAGYPDVSSAAVEIPDSVPIDGFSFQDSSLRGFNEGAAGQVDFTFTDPPGRGDHYRIKMTAIRDSIRGRVNFWRLGQAFAERDPCYYYYGAAIYLTDACFTASAQTLYLGLETVFSNPDDFREILKPKRIELRLETLTADYYEHLRSLSQPTGFEHAFIDPSPLHGNVTGGYGVLGAVNTTVVTIEF